MKPSTKEERRCRKCGHQKHAKRCGAPVDATLFDTESKPRCACEHREQGDPS